MVALVAGTTLIALAAFALLRAPDRRSQATTPGPRPVPGRSIAGIDKGSFLPSAPPLLAGAPGPVVAPEPELEASQVAFLRAASEKEAGEWRDLADADKEQQRAALKAIMLGGR